MKPKGEAIATTRTTLTTLPGLGTVLAGKVLGRPASAARCSSISASRVACIRCWASSGSGPPSPISRRPPSSRTLSAASAASSSSSSLDRPFGDTGIDFTLAP